MFARPSSSAYVCLRCYLRLSRQNPHALSSTLPQRYPFAVSCLRPFHSSRSSQWTDPLGSKDDDGESNSSPRRKDKHYHPLGKLRGKKGGRVRENAEALSVNALGAPAEVIVFRDATPNEIEEAGEQDHIDDAAKDSTRKAILESIQGEDTVMDQETVNQQIDALRPQVEDPNSGRSIIPAKQYLKLCQILMNGYSRPQLDAYIARSRESTPVEQGSKKLIGIKGSQITFRPWTPLSKAKHIETHLGLANNKSLREVKRNRIASSILKRCWKIEVAEEVERLGELVCTLPKAGIRLLSAGKPSHLDEVAENRQAKITIEGPNVHIIADRDSAVYVFEDMNRLWSLRHTEEFSLAMPASASAQPSSKGKHTPLVAFHPEDVAMVSSLTRTTMTYANNSKRTAVAIEGIGKESVEDAIRALLALVHIPTKHFVKTAIALPEDGAETVLQEISDLGAIPYRDRRTAFGRICSPRNRTHPELSITENIPNQIEPVEGLWEPGSDAVDVLKHKHKSVTATTLDDGPIDTLFGDRIRRNPLTTTHKGLADESFWSHTYQDPVSVSFGLALHPKSIDVASRISPAPQNDWNDALFLHRVPGLAQVLPRLIWDRENVVDVLSFRLLHNPWKQPGPVFPEIRMEFEINSLSEFVRTAELKSFHALTGDKSALAMLPSHAVDLSFNFKRTFHAALKNLESQTVVNQFIEQTKSNILDGSERLRAPSSVLIQIPYLFKTSHERKKLKYDSPEVANKHGVMAHYHFIGVEHLQIANYTFEGYPVRYTSIEAGKMGGRYGNLELMMPSSDSTEKYDKSKIAAQYTAFYKVAMQLAHLIDQAAHGTLKRPGPVIQPVEVDPEIDQEGMERWMPAHLHQPTMQNRQGREDEVGGTEQRPGDELLGIVGHHATVATETDAVISRRVDPGQEDGAPPVAKAEESARPIEKASDEFSPGLGQSTITESLYASEHEEEPETAKVDQRRAASG